ncbi:MAG: helix-turn-helix domain-containing protein [Candidatus Acidiferrum sp.]|jgi:excisionase family DNA binding protein
MGKNKKVFDVSELSQFITCREAAEIGHMHEVTIRRYLAERKLQRYKLGRKTLIRREDFMGLIQPQEIVAQE